MTEAKPATKRREIKAPVQRPLEAILWDAADKMRGNLEASEYKHVALGLVFLKYISDAFEQRHTYLEHATAEPGSDYYVEDPSRRHLISESRDEYTSEAVFWVPEEARWPHLQAKAKQPEIGVLLDAAMDAIERDASTSTFWASSRRPRARRRAPSTRPARWSGSWSRCWNRTRAACSTPAVVRAACSSSRPRSWLRTAGAARTSRSTVRRRRPRPGVWRG